MPTGKYKRYKHQGFQIGNQCAKLRKNKYYLRGKPWSSARRAATPRKSIIKNGKEYNIDWNKIRIMIYQRDSWKCQECGCKCLDKKRKIKGRVDQIL